MPFLIEADAARDAGDMLGLFLFFLHLSSAMACGRSDFDLGDPVVWAHFATPHC